MDHVTKFKNNLEGTTRARHKKIVITELDIDKSMGDIFIGGSAYYIQDKMKNKKVVKEFHFVDLSKEELKDVINNKYPIKISKLEFIIEKIYNKYPLISKTEITLIVKAVFESMRDFLVLGYVMNFNKFIFDMKLNFFTHVLNGKINPALRVKLKAPAKLKEKDAK